MLKNVGLVIAVLMVFVNKHPASLVLLLEHLATRLFPTHGLEMHNVTRNLIRLC